MKQPFQLSTLLKSVGLDFLTSRRPLILFSFAFKFAEALLILPLVAAGLAIILMMAGHIAVSNMDIVGFLMSPLGLLYAVIVAIVTVGLLLIEQAGYMSFAALADSVDRPKLSQYLKAAVRKPWRILQLGMLKLLFGTLALAPFALAAFLVYKFLLSEHDINFYLAEQPPVYWVALSLGVIILIGALCVISFLITRWSLALPIVLFEDQSAFAALKTSRERVRGASWRIGIILLGWFIGALLVGIALEIGFSHFAAFILANAGERPYVRIMMLLIAQAGLLATWTFIIIVVVALLAWRLYKMRNVELGLVQHDAQELLDDVKKPKAFNWKLALVSLALLLLSPIAIWLSLARFSADRLPLEVTAHRGHARAAPENTLSAVRKAIESGADYAEIDVLQTSDGVVILMHDRDLKRVSGDTRRVSDLTYEQIRKLDVGSWFGSTFTGERVPTLQEVFDLARGKIKLNIELKFYDNDLALARNVARLIKENDFEKKSIVTSFNYEALMEIKKINPNIRVGLIVAQALGNVSRLDVDLLSVRADWLSDKVLREAKRRGKEVHAWTINDPLAAATLIKRGVDNILTSDPDVIIPVRNEWARLTSSERFLLASRLLLGLDP